MLRAGAKQKERKSPGAKTAPRRRVRKAASSTVQDNSAAFLGIIVALLGAGFFWLSIVNTGVLSTASGILVVALQMGVVGLTLKTLSD